MRRQHNDPDRGIPAVDFYGDTLAWPTSELLHSERLTERSRPHDWIIRPHRHNELIQLFLVLDGSGRARLDSVMHDVAGNSLLIIPERVVHEFEWVRGSEGYVLSIRSHLIAALARRIEPLGSIFDNASVVDATASRDFLDQIFSEIHMECTAQRPLKDVSLDSLLRVLAIWLARHSMARKSLSTLPGRAGKHYARFVKLVDERHKLHWSVADYANALGITPSHLNAVCRQLVGKSSLDLIHARLVLAARRELAYTESNIAGVAHRLGFADPSYFARFFRRNTGMTPGEYRRRSAMPDAADA